jgi:hypothetical protein
LEEAARRAGKEAGWAGEEEGSGSSGGWSAWADTERAWKAALAAVVSALDLRFASSAWRTGGDRRRQVAVVLR